MLDLLFISIIIIIIIINCLNLLSQLRADSKEELCKPRRPQHTYYIVVIIVAGKKLHESEMKYTRE